MIHNAISALRNLHFLAKQSHVRYPVIIKGDETFFVSLLDSISDMTLVSDTLDYKRQILWPQLTSMLGQDIGSIALDIRGTLPVEKLCVVCGCITGGELLLLLVDENEGGSRSPFRQRFNRFFYHDSASIISQSGDVVISRQILPPSNHITSANCSFVTADQTIAIAAIQRVLSGHRRRPALLVADRGRGKSSAMGLAAAIIMTSAKKRIVVTSPIFANVSSLFMHALQCAQISANSTFSLRAINGSELHFIAPDRLLDEHPVCDLLLVDEAAAIPLPMLTQILEQYSRVVFSSTEHGYEGSGRAFSLRFRDLLEHKAKGWKEVTLNMPVRWAQNDPLEQWLFDAFLFNAELPLIKNIGKPHFRLVDKEALLANEPLLQQVFSLLVTAHYQTSPNDLIMLLDGQSQILLGAFYGTQLVGILLAQLEGGFDENTARMVVNGKRRLQGHLLAQSIASHTGVIQALTSSILRVVRIAVHPDCRERGIGRGLVRKIEAHAAQHDILYLGASFGVTDKLWRFWHSLGYLSVRLGVQRDAASGTFSLQIIKPLSETPAWLSDLLVLFSINFTQQLSGLFQQMDIQIAINLLSQYQKVDAPCAAVNQQVELFSRGALGYDLAMGSLHVWFVDWLVNSGEIADENFDCALFFAKLMQRKSWAEIANQFGYTGRKQSENAMRNWVASVLN